jgi:hypothetical protein
MRESIGKLFGLLSLIFLLSACKSSSLTPTHSPVVDKTLTVITNTPPPTKQTPSTVTQLVEATLQPADEAMPAEIELASENWRLWAEVPVITRAMRDIYLLGQALGNDPYAISILGDCQSTPETFLGLYEADATESISLPQHLQETVTYFDKTFNRQSPTIKSGTTSGALLWAEWHEGDFGCDSDETPLDCELRLNRPSFAIITVGTHWESNNEVYMRKIIEELLAQGVVPILSTKADNREGEHGINLETAKLAKEYNLPLWNFWLATKALPNHGLYTKKGDEHLGDIYLTEEALALRRYSALAALDATWRAVAVTPFK